MSWKSVPSAIPLIKEKQFYKLLPMTKSLTKKENNTIDKDELSENGMNLVGPEFVTFSVGLSASCSISVGLAE